MLTTSSAHGSPDGTGAFLPASAKPAAFPCRLRPHNALAQGRLQHDELLSMQEQRGPRALDVVWFPSPLPWRP